MSLVFENHIDMLAIMPTGHGKSLIFMVPAMVMNQTIIVFMSLAILTHKHEMEANRNKLQYATYGVKNIIYDDPPPIMFVLVERVRTRRFVELVHILKHFEKLHYIVVDKAHLLLCNFKPAMTKLLPFVAMTTSLSPPQKQQLMIAMSTLFTVIRMATMWPLIEYNIDEVANMAREILKQLVEWDGG
ncbi:unnamed protein product, partial [Sphagnum compactum]